MGSEMFLLNQIAFNDYSWCHFCERADKVWRNPCFTFVNADLFIAACVPKTCVNGYFDKALCKCICPKENYGELCEGAYVFIANKYCIVDKEITGTQHVK